MSCQNHSKILEKTNPDGGEGSNFRVPLFSRTYSTQERGAEKKVGKLNLPTPHADIQHTREKKDNIRRALPPETLLGLFFSLSRRP